MPLVLFTTEQNKLCTNGITTVMVNHLNFSHELNQVLQVLTDHVNIICV